jgi:hypothetical protein
MVAIHRQKLRRAAKRCVSEPDAGGSLRMHKGQSGCTHEGRPAQPALADDAGTCLGGGDIAAPHSAVTRRTARRPLRHTSRPPDGA